MLTIRRNNSFSYKTEKLLFLIQYNHLVEKKIMGNLDLPIWPKIFATLESLVT